MLKEARITAFMQEPELFRANEWTERLGVTVYKVEGAKKVAEIKELLCKYDLTGTRIIAFDNKKLVKWLCKLPTEGFFGGSLFEPREEAKHLFQPDAQIMFVPPGLNAWSEPEVYEADWKFACNSIEGVDVGYSDEWRDESLEITLSKDTLACDIETTGVNYGTDRIRTIGFSWQEDSTLYRYATLWEEADKALLTSWLKSESIKVFHNGSFDLTFLCRDLGIHPLEVRGVVDTRLLAYCAYNSARSANCSLEYLARHFLPPWKIDSRKFNGQTLLDYNSRDCAATLYLYLTLPRVPFSEKIHELIPKVVGMQLVGWPLDKDRVNQLGSTLSDLRAQKLLKITKAVPDLNPNSPKQLSDLFFKQWKLDSYGKTSSGNEETGAKALEYFLAQLEGSPEKASLVQHILDFKEVDTVAGTFIPPMMAAVAHDGFMRGSYTIGGTKSGRLSSNNPNLQNQPSNSTFSKQFKGCFRPPEGWVLIGADYKSLEDRVSALTTRDKQKLKIYTDGFDGHCLRANAYFDLGIDPNNVEAINQIAKTYEELRQKSKGPTFALTYQGTVVTLIKQCGFDYVTARKIYTSFHTLYRESDEWVEKQLEQGKKDGVVNLAYGHRIKSPLLKTSVQGKGAPYVTVKEFRTVANALGQSYCMVTGFTSYAMYREIYDLGLKDDILPVGEIHDANYWLVRDDPTVIGKARELMLRHMPNHGLPELEHPTIKLDIDPFIIRDSWANPEPL